MPLQIEELAIRARELVFAAVQFNNEFNFSELEQFDSAADISYDHPLAKSLLSKFATTVKIFNDLHEARSKLPDTEDSTQPLLTQAYKNFVSSIDAIIFSQPIVDTLHFVQAMKNYWLNKEIDKLKNQREEIVRKHNDLLDKALTEGIDRAASELAVEMLSKGIKITSQSKTKPLTPQPNFPAYSNPPPVNPAYRDEKQQPNIASQTKKSRSGDDSLTCKSQTSQNGNGSNDSPNHHHSPESDKEFFNNKKDYFNVPPPSYEESQASYALSGLSSKSMFASQAGKPTISDAKKVDGNKVSPADRFQQQQPPSIAKSLGSVVNAPIDRKNQILRELKEVENLYQISEERYKFLTAQYPTLITYQGRDANLKEKQGLTKESIGHYKRHHKLRYALETEFPEEEIYPTISDLFPQYGKQANAEKNNSKKASSANSARCVIM